MDYIILLLILIKEYDAVFIIINKFIKFIKLIFKKII